MINSVPSLNSARLRLEEYGLKSSIENYRGRDVLILPLSENVSYTYEVGPNHTWSVASVFSLLTDGEMIPAMGKDEDESEIGQDYRFNPSQDPIQLSNPPYPGIKYFADIISWGKPDLSALEEMKRLQSQL